MEFRKWLQLQEHGGVTGKTGLYPSGYAGIGLYPPQTFITASADGIYYLSQDDRFYKGKENKPYDITHIPGRPSYPANLDPNNQDKAPHSIEHIPGKSTPEQGKNLGLPIGNNKNLPV